MIRLKTFINLRWSKRIIHTSINAPSEFPFLDYWSWSFSIYSWWFRWIFETMTPGQTTSVMGFKWLWVPAFMVTKILMTKGHQQQMSIITLCLTRAIFRKPLPTITHSQSCIMHCCTVHWFGLVKPSLNKKLHIKFDQWLFVLIPCSWNQVMLISCEKFQIENKLKHAVPFIWLMYTS